MERKATAPDNRVTSSTDRVQNIYQRMFDAIVQHHIPPGTRLPEAHLARIFGVSRTLVRQALQRLTLEHLVTQEPNRGMRVAMPTADEVRHIYGVRRLIECNMIDAVIARISKARLREIKRTLTREEQANARGDKQEAMQLAGQFHLELAQALDNPVLVEILRELISRGDVAIAVYEQSGRSACRCDDHRRILDHILSGDVRGAREQMRRHLQDMENNLSLDRQKAGPVNLGLILAGKGR
jgi:DNA-binding GntR family transcriptional regulator